MSIRASLLRFIAAVSITIGVLAAQRALAPQVAATAPCATGSACAAPEVAEGAITAAALPSGAPRLVAFGSAYCAACKRMAPILSALEARCARAGASILHVEVDDDHGAALARRYGVHHLPTYLGVDASGAEVERVVGEQPGERLDVLLAEVRGEACPKL